MKICYGLMRDDDGNYAINEKEADTVRLVFHLYQHGLSLGKIVEHLAMRNIFSPTGKPTWTRAAIDKMLGNQKYIAIIGMDEFLTTQVERDYRSNIDEENGKRKAVRYCSKNASGGFHISTHL